MKGSIRILSFAFIAMIIGGPAAASEAAAEPAPGAACPVGGQPMRNVTLFFGMAIPGGGGVSDDDWRSFLDGEVTPRFPDGLSVFETAGQWRDAATGAVVREKSRALQIWYAPSEEASRSIEAVRDAYKARFRQDSVMRVDDLDCVDF